MPLRNKVVDALNEIRASEQRMALVYRRAAQMVTGPWRKALVDEFKEHADDEDKHAEIAMRHIVALGGDPTEEVKEIPVWHNLDELLAGLDDLEEKGIKKWQNVMKLLDTDDAFRHTIEEILSTEQGHCDEVKHWRRKDYSDMARKSFGDRGSPKPLNWKDPQFAADDNVKKSTPWRERIDAHNRYGTPPTRRGGFHGAPSGLEPGVPAELNPQLVLGKAVLTPTKQTPEGTVKQKPRKRDPHGQFATGQAAGKQSTAQEDKERLDRQSQLAATRQRTSLNPSWGGKTRMGMTNKPIKKAAPEGQEQAVNVTNDPLSTRMMPSSGQPMGMAPSGIPIYDDPYHPEHANMTAEDHNAAAELHNKASVDASGKGNHVAALMSQQRANIHRDLGADQQLPMERIMQAQPQSGAQPPHSLQRALPGAGNEENPMDKFLSTQHQEDQGKPIFQDRSSQGPLPGMYDNRTNSPIGPQTPQMGHAGTVPQPQGMPQAPTGSSMPDIGGNQGTMTGPPPPMTPGMPMPPQMGQPGQMNMQQMQPPAPMLGQTLLDQLLARQAPQQMPQMPSPQPPQGMNAGGPPQQGRSFGQQSQGGYESGDEAEDTAPETAPFGGDDKEEKSNQESHKNATKSLEAWLRKRS